MAEEGQTERRSAGYDQETTPVWQRPDIARKFYPKKGPTVDATKPIEVLEKDGTTSEYNPRDIEDIEHIVRQPQRRNLIRETFGKLFRL